MKDKIRGLNGVRLGKSFVDYWNDFGFYLE